MRKKYLHIIFYTLAFYGLKLWGLQAQEVAPCQVPKISADLAFCFHHEAFNGWHVGFAATDDIFYVVNPKKKVKTINYQGLFETLYPVPPSSVPQDKDPVLSYLLLLTQNKKLGKISAAEILLIQQALLTWRSEKRALGYTFTASGLGIKVITEGSGSVPEQGEKVKVQYNGYLLDGTLFDSSYQRDQVFTFALQTQQVIKGWDEGIGTLKKGSTAFLYIPADLGYGERSRGKIPANATLIFYVQLFED